MSGATTTTATSRLPFPRQGSVKRKKSSIIPGTNEPMPSAQSISRSPSIALSAECLYTMQEPSATNLGAPQQFHRPSMKRASEPLLIRYLRCSAVLPNIPLQSATRVIAMFKCFRKVLPPGSRASATPTIETLYSHFSRIWPKESDTSAAVSTPTEEGVQSLVMYDKNCRVDFVLPVAEDLPQSLSLPGGGSIYYTLQIQANLSLPSKKEGEASVYSQELVVPIPAPESAYSPSRLPRRITTAHMTGHAQEHFGILITPDISLHVSVPQEIHYARHQHSVFKIHLKLMPHPPEAKLPAIAKLEWKLTQRTQIGHLNKTSTSEWPSAGAFSESTTKPNFPNTSKHPSQSKKQTKLGESKAVLASGLISFANATEAPSTPVSKGRFSSAGKHAGQGAAAQAKQAAAQVETNAHSNAATGSNSEDAMMGGSRKDQYLYIALPEQSALLQPMSDNNPFLEILHQLEIELFPFHASNSAGGLNASGTNALSKTFFNWKQSLSSWSKKHPTGSGSDTAGSATSARDRWQAEIPVKITLAFDQHDKLTNAVSTMTPAARSLSSSGPSPALTQGSARGERGFNGPALIAPGPGYGHVGQLAISSGA